jgi:hypothetical protein
MRMRWHERVSRGAPGGKDACDRNPCVKCGSKRIHKRWKKGRHRKLCHTCATSVKRIKFTCVGYRDHDAHRYAQTCPRTMRLPPYEVNARQRLKERFPNSLFDVPSKTYQCNSCAGAARLIANKEKELRALAKQNPHLNIPKIRSHGQRIRLLRDHHAELSPNFKPTREAQELGRRNYAPGKPRPNLTKANLVRRWFRFSGELPKRIRFGICIVCNKIAITYNPEEPHFHWSCHQKWQATSEGKSFQSLRVRGRAASLPTPKPGRRVTEDSLRESYSWAIRYYFRDISFDEIAKQNNLSPKAVELRVKSIIARLPEPDLVSARFRRLNCS